MANRLTWQNVAAPDFSEALRGQAVAADLFGRAANSISGALGARDTRLRTQDSNEAMARALQIQDPNEWDRIMATQGIAGLGIDPSRATNELMTFAQGRGATLDAAADADYNRQRSLKADAEADAQKRLTKEAMSAAYGLVPGSTTKEEARSMLLRQSREQGWDVKKTQTALSEVDKLDDGFWQASSGSTNEAANLDPVIGIDEQLTREQDNMNLRYGSNDVLRLYGAAVQKYDGASNVAAELAEEIRSKKDAATSDEEKELYETSAGNVAGIFSRLQGDYSLPPEVIGMAMRNAIEGNGWVFDGDKLDISEKAARTLLDQMGTPEGLKILAEGKAQVERDNRRISSAQAALVEGQRLYALGKDRGDDALMKRGRDMLDSLAKELGIGGDPGALAPGASPGAASGMGIAGAIDPWAFLGPVSTGASPAAGGVAGAPQANTPEARGMAALAEAARVGIDPRVIEAQEQAKGALSWLKAGAREVDGMFGDAAALPMRAYAGLQSGFGQGLGVVAPELGSDVVRRSDTLGRWADGLAADGFVPEGAIEGIPVPYVPSLGQADLAAALGENIQPTSLRGMEQTPDPVFDSALRDPLTTFEAVAAETGLDTRPGSRISLVQEALATGTDPTTLKPLTREQEQAFKKELVRAVKTIKGRYRSRGQNDPIQRLLDNPDEWLK